MRWHNFCWKFVRLRLQACVHQICCDVKTSASFIGELRKLLHSGMDKCAYFVFFVQYSISLGTPLCTLQFVLFVSYIVDSNSRFGLSVNLLWMLLSTKASSTRCSSSWTKGAPQINGSIRGSCSLAIAIPVQRHVGHITFPEPEQFGHLSVFGADKG